LAAISPLTHIIWDIKGAQHSTIKKLHDQYGDVIRISPNALAYRAAPAWRDIYGHRKKGQKIFYKDPALYTPLPNGMNSLLTANEADHARMRRLLTHAFSNKALKEQEPILHVYADLLIQRLDEQIAPSSQATAFIDICRWFNFTTFDIIGDLSFGEPFGCLQDSQYHWWVSTITDAVKASCYLKILWFYPLMSVLARFLVPKHLMEKRADTFNLSVEKVDRRLKRDTARPDFTSYIMKHDRDGKCMSRGEIDANAASFVVAGSETTAALLSGCIFYITQHPDKYNRLISEIRGAFKSEADIQLSALSTLPYLNAVLEETLRIYPPIPAMLPRLVPEGGAIINGQFVNKGVRISFPQLVEPNTLAA
jgi:cytochrome P450